MTIHKKGTLQRQRPKTNLLNPEFKIDDRSFEDILAYTVAFVEHINFFNTENEVDGNWKTLIQQDPIIYIIGIIKAPVTNLQSEHTTKDAQINTLLSWYTTIENWYHTLLFFKADALANKIGNVLLDVLQDKKIALENALKANTNTIDLDDATHTFRKMILYIQNFTSNHLKNNIFSRNNHMPNNAMYIAFAILFQKIQDQMNALGQAHLDFYYKHVLQQTVAAGIATQTIVCFELAKTAKGILIPEKTALNAGKHFESKQNISFETLKPLLVAPISVEAAYTLYFNKSPFIKIGTQKPTISNIIKQTLISKKSTLPTNLNTPLFGANEDTLTNASVTEATTTQIGCIIASPVLFLEEGKRDVKITFQLDNETAKANLWQLLKQMTTQLNEPLDVVFQDTFQNAFNITYSSTKQWVSIPNYVVDYTDSTFSIQLQLEANQPPLDATTAHPHTTFPMVKIVLNAYAPAYAYSFFKDVRLNAITIDTKVTNAKNLALYNPVGKMPLTKAFNLFGASPNIGSYLMVGKSELFKKELSTVNINLHWDNLPQDFGGFTTYYDAYNQNITNNSFKVDITALSNGYWFPRDEHKRPTQNVFATTPAITPEGYKSDILASKTALPLSNLEQYKLTRNYSQRDPIPFNVHTNSGFFKLELKAPKFAFGKELYTKKYREIAAQNAKNDETSPLPNKPYIPKVKQVTLDYTASDTIYFNNAYDDSSENVLGNYMHITPFGLETIVENSSVYKNTMFTHFEGSGYLYLKLSKIQTATTIALYFDLKNDTPENNPHDNNIKIQYKKMERWENLPSKNIIADGTHQLNTSGILELLLPYFDTNEDAYTIRFIALKDAYTYPKIKGIYTNAVIAKCTSESPDIIGKTIPAFSIHKPSSKIADLKKIIQPADSFGGKTPTPPDLLYTAVSERLKHKDRALTIWDFEHLILERFPEVTAVKCTNYNKFFKPQAGQLTVIVLSDQWKHNDHHYFDTNTLKIIQHFITQKANAFIKITVRNPKVEWLLVNCFVTFYKNDQGGYYLEALNTAISEYLSPLSYSDSTTIEGIGATVVPRMLRSHIENLPYIETVKQLDVEHIVKLGLDNYTSKVYAEDDTISPTTPWSILAPKPKHKIFSTAILEEETITEIENENLQIGVDYIITADINTTTETDTVDTLKAESKTEENTKEKRITKAAETQDDTILTFKIK